MSEESIHEADLLKRLERWTEKPPSRLEIEDLLQDVTFNQIVESVQRLLGYIEYQR